MTRIHRFLFKNTRKFAHSERGSALIMVGLSMGVLIGSAGIAIDMGRVQIVQAKLTNALDAAGLAAGATVGTNDMTGVVLKYFYANYPKHPETYLGATITDPTVTPNGDNSVLTLNVAGTVPTTFMRMMGINSVPISARSEVTRASMGMELVLVLDVTGSMNCPTSGNCPSTNSEQANSKIGALRSAGANLINILFGSNNTVPNLWVGVVPFSQSVNIGTSRDSWTSAPANFTTWGPATSTWWGCVEARATNGRDVTDDPPTIEAFPKYYAPCNPDTGTNDAATNAWYGTNSSSSNGNPAFGNCVYDVTPPTVHSYRSPLNRDLGPNQGCTQLEILAMTGSKSSILNRISTLVADGMTEIPLGLSWGWRLISPRWQNLWGGEMNINNLPLAYHTPLMHKVVILMTDGDNDISWDTYSAYGTPPGTTQLGANPCLASNQSNCNNGEDLLDSKTSQICTSMKNEGVVIYSIAFGSGISAASQTMLRNCASSPDYFFLSPTNAALQTAFTQIGNSLANLRISQ